MARFQYDCGLGQSIWDILLNYSQRIFGAQWVAALQHGSLSYNPIGQNAFYLTQALVKRLKIKKKNNIPNSSIGSIRWGLSLENPLLKFSIKFQFIEIWAFVARSSIKRNAKSICDNFWRLENYSKSMKHFLLLLLRNTTKHNSIKLSAARLHVSSDKFWNCLKDLICNNDKNYCLLVNKRTYSQ